MELKCNMSKIMTDQSISVVALLGSVGVGKSAIVEFLTGSSPKKFENENITGTTIRMGYEEALIYKNKKTCKLSINLKNPTDDDILVRRFSIKDNPGHNAYMVSLITGSETVDNAMFIVSMTDGIENQSRQHMKCFKMTNCSKICFCISKIDLAPTKQKVETRINEIYNFMEEENLDENIDPFIIPISTKKESSINIDKVIRYLANTSFDFNKIQSKIDKHFIFPIIRSFDVNRPGTSLKNMKGGVFGGALNSGFICKNDIICIIPGIVSNDSCLPLITKVVNIHSGTKYIDFAIPGGYVGIETTLDTELFKHDGMVGQVVFKMKNPNVESLLNSVNCKITKTCYVKNMNVFEDHTFIIGQKYLLIIHGKEVIATLQDNDDNNNYLFSLFQPCALINDENVAILEILQNSNTLNVIAHANIDIKSNMRNIIINMQDDINDFINKNIFQAYSSLKLINDIEDLNDSMDDILDADKLKNNLTFDHSIFSPDFISISLHKTSTSVSIINPCEVFSQFSDDNEILANIYNQFANFVKNRHDNLKDNRVTYQIEANKITYNDVKRTMKSLFVGDFNKDVDEFVTENFKCKSCNAIGSIKHSKNNIICRACNAIISIKK